jgi:hypothetical protein
MTSAAFPPIAVGFGVTTLMRRGARVAAFYGVPLGAIYATWYVVYGRDGATPLDLSTQAIRFAGQMFWATFDALAQGGVGAVLVAVAGLGLGAAVQRAWRSRAWDDAALPVGLLVSWTGFAGLTALARAKLPETYDSGRYLHVGAALLLPLVAAGAEQLARHRLLLATVALLPLAIGVPGNLDGLSHTDWPLRGNRQLIFGMAHSPFVDDVPPNTKPTPGGPLQLPLTAGWLARQEDRGRIPAPDRSDPVADLTATSWLVLSQMDGPSGPACPRLTGPLMLTLDAGDQIEFSGALSVTTTYGPHESQPRPFASRDGSVLQTQAGPVDVIVRPQLGQEPHVCAPRGSH